MVKLLKSLWNGWVRMNRRHQREYEDRWEDWQW